MPNAGAGTLSMRYGLRGQSFSVASACAAGSHAIGVATRMIQYGDADAVLTGGGEATLTPLARASFEAAGALSPSGISRPFDARRDGFVMGEGAGILLLEDAERAAERGASVLGEVLGYGSTSDAYHLTAPEPEGRHAAEAIRIALADAGRDPRRLDYVNAHGTSTPINDASETLAIKLALGEDARARCPSRRRSRRSATCSAPPAPSRRSRRCARCASASLPPTLGLDQPDPELDLDYVPLTARRSRREASGRSRCRTRSGSAATTSSSAWKGSPHERHRRRRDRAERLTPHERLEMLVRRRLVRADPLAASLVAEARRARPRGRRRRRRRSAASTGARSPATRRTPRFLGGSLGAAHADTIVRVLQLAGRARVPVVGFIESGGARMQEGTAALGGYGRIFRQNVALTRHRAADLDHRRALGRRRLLLAGADRLRRDDARTRRCS